MEGVQRGLHPVKGYNGVIKIYNITYLNDLQAGVDQAIVESMIVCVNV